MPVQGPNFKVVWSEEDKEFVATCAEFPSLSCLDEDPIKALRGLLSVIETIDSADRSEEVVAHHSV